MQDMECDIQDMNFDILGDIVLQQLDINILNYQIFTKLGLWIITKMSNMN